ncbi:MAG: bifunctional hydroxymethylpyrimidine kinase/phosphomethylpyrimidine kinase [Pseudomonadota bacterium]
MPVPTALTIAGSDSGGGAGVQADLKVFSALGVFGTSAITLVTAQNTRGVTGIEMLSTAMVRSQIAAVVEDFPVRAIKIGALGTAEMIETVADALRPLDLPLVLDPVMIAKSGDPLLAADAVGVLISHLLPLATVVTPNLPEAAALLGGTEAAAETDIAAQGQAIRALGPDWVLMKGGHGAGPDSTDLLVGAQTSRLEAKRIATTNTHGTGCALSAAIAAGIAHGLPVDQAVVRAKAYLTRALAGADALELGAGHGPVDHFHALWPLLGSDTLETPKSCG